MVKTLVHEDKTLRRISYRIEGANQKRSFYATGNHPFWTIERQIHLDDKDEWVTEDRVTGWTPADDLLRDGTRLNQFADGRFAEPYEDARHHHLVQMADGRLAEIIDNAPVYRTEHPSCGWSRYSGQLPFEPDDSLDGAIFDFANNQVVENGAPLDHLICFGDDPYFKTRVYNIEVEDFHTYYVANGIWVHE